MDAQQYQELALRTEKTPTFVRLGKGEDHDVLVSRAIHACLGLTSEVGEIADALKKHLIYGKELDTINILEESGDLSWYQALLMAATKQSLGVAMERNIAKLRQRFGDVFSVEAALNRDLPAERRALEGGTHGKENADAGARESAAELPGARAGEDPTA